LKGSNASRFLSFSPPPRRWFTDIVDAIAIIEQFTSGMDFEAFRSTRWPFRQLSANCKSSARPQRGLGNEAERQVPDQPWWAIRGIGTNFAMPMNELMPPRAVGHIKNDSA
jgi:uncharacterized protein with HEPN domain